jgi:DNA-binding transcriptional LysR family regulator
MNINEVETFLTIIRLKNIRKASEVLFISQSAASQRLIMLEKKIGYSLIERKKGFKEVELTVYGKTFLPLAERWLELYQEMNLSKIKNIRVPLCIGAMGSINQPILAGFYSKLAKGDCGISFDLKICTNRSDELYELLDKRKIDIGIVSEEYVYENIFVRKIFEEKMYVIKEKNDYDQNGYAMKPEELRRENEINISWSVKNAFDE